jgi:hypothetical protein
MKCVQTKRAGVFDNNDVHHEGWELIITFTEEEIEELILNYDQNDNNSPSEIYSRPIFREILNKIIQERS